MKASGLPGPAKENYQIQPDHTCSDLFETTTTNLLLQILLFLFYVYFTQHLFDLDRYKCRLKIVSQRIFNFRFISSM